MIPSLAYYYVNNLYIFYESMCIMCMSFIIDVYCLPFSIHQAIENQEADKDDIESNDVVVLQESSD